MAEQLVDEHPDAYKPIAQVMADQADLVEVVHELHQVVNLKGDVRAPTTTVELLNEGGRRQ